MRAVLTQADALATLQNSHKRVLRAVLHKDSPETEAIFYFVRQESASWTPRDWGERLAALTRCEDKLGDWLATRL
jgi:hypothetical protein